MIQVKFKEPNFSQEWRYNFFTKYDSMKPFEAIKDELVKQ